MKKYIILVVIFGFLEIMGKEAVITSDHTGKSDAAKNIEGLLIEKGYIAIFKDDKLSGPSVYLAKDSDEVYYIATQLFFKNDVLQGSCMDYYPNGVIKCLVTNIVQNTDYPELKHEYPFQSYCYEYYENGKIKAEGWGLIEEYIMIGDSIRIGSWKYYDSNGDVTEVEYPREFDSIEGRWLF